MEDAGDELEAEMGMEPADDDGEDKGDMEELEDRVVDTEEAIANLQKEFEELLNKEEGGDDEMEAPADMEEPAEESIATEETEEASDETVEEMKHDKKDMKKKDMDKKDMKKESTEEEGISEEDTNEVAEDEEQVDESKLEMAPKADMADHADQKASPVAKQQKGGMAVKSPEESGRPAPKAQDMGGTTKPDMKKV